MMILSVNASADVEGSAVPSLGDLSYPLDGVRRAGQPPSATIFLAGSRNLQSFIGDQAVNIIVIVVRILLTPIRRCAD